MNMYACCVENVHVVPPPRLGCSIALILAFISSIVETQIPGTSYFHSIRSSRHRVLDPRNLIMHNILRSTSIDHHAVTVISTPVGYPWLAFSVHENSALLLTKCVLCCAPSENTTAIILVHKLKCSVWKLGST